MLLVEFRSAGLLKNFGFTENPYCKSCFVLLVSGLLYDEKSTGVFPTQMFTLACVAGTAVLMLCISPCSKRPKKI